ncbi:MAG: DUF2339 domain-containing protein [Tepidisphaeraceae bacterium]
MSMSERTDGDFDRLAAHVLKLEERVAWLERQLLTKKAGQPVPPPLPVARPVETEPVSPAPAAPAVWPPPEVAPAMVAVPARSVRAAALQRVVQPIGSTPERSLEQAIGQKLALWIGAGVLLLGVLFFLQYAWNEGWIRPSPMARLVIALLIGAGLGALGEWQYRRGMKPFAAVLSGLAVAIAMASFYAGVSELGGRVIESSTALVGVSIAGVMAVVQALRMKLITPLVVAEVGALAAPLVLGPEFFVPSLTVGYVLTIALIACGVTLLRPTWLAVTAIAAIGAWLHLFLGVPNADGALVAIGVWSATLLFTTTLILTSRRSSGEVPDQALATFLPIVLAPAWLRLVLLSGGTQGVLSLGKFDPMLAVCTVLLATVALAVAWAARGAAIRFVGFGIALVLATLVPIMLLDRFALSMAWLAMAAVSAGAGWATRKTIPFVWGIVLWALCLARLVSVDIVDPQLQRVVAMIGPYIITGWTLFGAALALFGWGLAWLQARRPMPAVMAGSTAPLRVLAYASPVPDRIDGVSIGSVVLTVVGILVWAFVAFRTVPTGGPAWTLLMALANGTLLAASLLPTRTGWRAVALVTAFIVGLKWFVADIAGPALNTFHQHAANPPLPAANLAAIAGAMLLAEVAVIGALARRANPPAQDVAAACTGAFALGTLAWLSGEALHVVDRIGLGQTLARPDLVKHMTLSVLWAVSGFGGIVAGFMLRSSPTRYVSLAVLALTLLKIVGLDMAEVQTVWRVLTFMAVGVMLMGVSYVYFLYDASQRGKAGSASAGSVPLED